METEKSKQLFLVLVPHRDTRLILRNYSVQVLKSDITGAYSVPWVAPLASVSAPLETQELKKIAHSFRKSAINGKFNAEGAYSIPFPLKEKDMFLFGPRLDLPIQPDLPASGVSQFYTTTVIGACLFRGSQNKNGLPCPPALSFSAAAVANMFWQPVNLPGQDTNSGVIGYKWKISKLCWLPKKA